MTRQNDVSGLVPTIGEYSPAKISDSYVKGLENMMSDFDDCSSPPKLNRLLPTAMVDWKDDDPAESSVTKSTHEPASLSDSESEATNIIQKIELSI
ncbi:hypothetical protein PGT21_009183 [Puccinia graminis f. sp. tritici]|nr:hypothetical protein PGT21_009183 [Puccinia graminis f. sp. tritici]